MKGANIFVIYADGKGNITLSPRLGTEHAQPKYNPDAQVELLDGSGVSNGIMNANVKCSNCSTWNGGSMDLKADTTTWSGAGLQGPALNSTDLELNIQKHFVRATWPWNMADARGGDDRNPFTIAEDSPPPRKLGGVGTPTAVAHGVLASLAFLIMFPSGAIFIRFARFRGLVWIHAAVQLTGYFVYVAAAGLGIHMLAVYPMKYRRYDLYRDPHPKIGLALLAYLFFQPISGFINHWLFGKKGKRLFSHHIHIWGGRLAIILGIINGGFGMRLGQVEYPGYRAAYGVVATVMGVAFLALIVFAQAQRHGPNPSLLHRGGEDGHQATGGEGQGHVRMESMEDRERLHAANVDRVE